jgi:hypothetical protein
MILTLLGVIILLVPFLLIYKFKDKRLGFVTILAFFLIFHLAVAVLTQALGIFTYLAVVLISLAADVFVLYKINFSDFKRQFGNFKPDFILLALVVVAFLTLHSVHNNYTGIVTSAFVPFSEVSNMAYPYPYFSDEWTAVSLIQYSVSSGKLPIVNPLWENSRFNNLELPFHSFVSELMLVLNLNPLIQYSLLHVFSGVLICALVYLILVNLVGRIASSAAGLSVLYIVNGANLPGLWTLIPIVLGMIAFLSCLFFMVVKQRRMVFVSSFLTLIFYPPLFVLNLAAVLAYFFQEEGSKVKKRSLLIYFGICVFSGVLLLIVSLTVFSFSESLSFIQTRVFYPTFTANAVPDFSAWKVIPVIVLFFSVLGLFSGKKRFFLLAPIAVGLVYWIVYSQVLWRFIIEYERVVFASSVLIVMFSGFGIQLVLDYVRKNHDTKKYPVFALIQASVLILFLLLSFSYTQRDGWKELKLHPLSGGTVSPAAPANTYLIEDDLEIFRGMKEKRFLSAPWKGTVIGAATGNYPLETKSATITNQILSYSEFVRATCEKKTELAEKYGVDYVYTPEFHCRSFKEIAVSGENLHLYSFIV